MKINSDFCCAVTDKNKLFVLLAAMVVFTISACSNTPRLGQPSHSYAKAGGGYYLDDGPEQNPPSNLASVPDAVPRIESLKTTTMRPYVALGKTYTPMTALKAYKARGHASWYGKRYHGKRTASGEVYDMYAMTAAHPTLPIPSYVRVTNLQNGNSAVVRINDRGPFLENRLIDLSYVAAYKLGILTNGSARVEVESIIPGHSGSTGLSVITRKHTDRESTAASSRDNEKLYLQLAAFGSVHNAKSYLAQLRSELPFMTQETHINQASGLHKILVGPFPDLETANRTANIITRAGSPEPILVRHAY